MLMLNKNISIVSDAWRHIFASVYKNVRLCMIMVGAISMKHYSYSVKEELGKYFGADTLNKMRSYDSAYVHDTAEEKKHMIPLLWYHADEEAMGMFLSKHFLLETLLCDDYIAYIVQEDKEKAVFLSFIYTDKEAPFPLDPEYAYALAQEWRAKGFSYGLMVARYTIWHCWRLRK